MNVQNLKDNYPDLINHMKKEGYSESYINYISYEIKRIIKFHQEKKWSSYEDVYYAYEEYCSKLTLANKRIYLNIIKCFDLYNDYPNGKRRPCFMPSNAYSKLYSEFKAVVECYCDIERKNGKAENTIYTNQDRISNFFLFLYQHGCSCLDEITIKAVQSFFISDNKVCRSYSNKNGIESALRACIPIYPKCEDIIGYLPRIKNKRENIQYLTHEEVDKFKEALKKNNNSLTFRDKAVGYVVAYLGLRNCDVTKLTLDSIDWNNDILYIKQQKTGISLKLPLTAIIGNAIYLYIMRERKQTHSKYLFISHNRPFGKLTPSSISFIINKIMNIAGIRQNSGDRKGSHIFRHYTATKLIGNGIAQPVVSTILGHSHPSSLNTYLSADFINLKKCALDIEIFNLEVSTDGKV